MAGPMGAALLRLLTLLLLTGLLSLAAAVAQDDPPANSDPAQAEDPAPEDGGAAVEPDAPDDATAAEDSEAGAEEAPPARAGALRRRPRTAEEERAWKELNAPNDPFLFIPEQLGPAPGVGGFYNPQDHVEPQVSPSLARYIIQDQAGQVLGYLTLALSRVDHPEFGDCVQAGLYYDDDDPHELTLWLDPRTLQPLRLERQQRLVPGAAEQAPAPAAAPAGPNQDYAAQLNQLQQLQRDRVEYTFDRVRHWRTKGAISLAPGSLRQRAFSYELAQLPVLARQLKPHGETWPFTAPLVDGLRLRNLDLSVAAPTYVDVTSAEPAACQCYELRFACAGEEQVFWVERSLPRRLIKFARGGRTYNLFEYSASN